MISFQHSVVFTTFLVLICSDSIKSAEEQLKIEVLSKPEECTAKSKNGDMLTMHYNGSLADGTKFDSRPYLFAAEPLVYKQMYKYMTGIVKFGQKEGSADKTGKNSTECYKYNAQKFVGSNAAKI